MWPSTHLYSHSHKLPLHTPFTDWHPRHLTIGLPLPFGQLPITCGEISKINRLYQRTPKWKWTIRCSLSDRSGDPLMCPLSIYLCSNIDAGSSQLLWLWREKNYVYYGYLLITIEDDAVLKIPVGNSSLWYWCGNIFILRNIAPCKFQFHYV